MKNYSVPSPISYVPSSADRYKMGSRAAKCGPFLLSLGVSIRRKRYYSKAIQKWVQATIDRRGGYRSDCYIKCVRGIDETGRCAIDVTGTIAK